MSYNPTAYAQNFRSDGQYDGYGQAQTMYAPQGMNYYMPPASQTQMQEPDFKPMMRTVQIERAPPS
jgi:hypothetical protein